jgi:DNA-binding NtrC family response regulator
LIELADGGTLFLDEVTELPAQLQAKLLRAIETRTFFRVGGVRKVEVNVRIVAATNRNLDTVVNDGVFRSDLLYRINGFQINLAPLRERPEDIEPLSRFLLKHVGGTVQPELTEEALSALRGYGWPGNVRQLKNCLERAVILSNNGRITLSELPPEVVRPAPIAGVAPVGVVQPAAGLDGTATAAPVGAPGSLREVERQQILAALEQTGWHRGKTAEILGISPSTLYRRLRDYDLERRR